MRKSILMLLLLAGFTANAQFGFIQFNQDEEASISVVVDPTFTDRGADIGVEVRKELLWGWVAGGVSHYEELTPSYTAVTGSGGINVNVISEDVTVYTGLRLGVAFRAGNPYPLYGGVIGFDVEVFDGVRIGGRHWLDHREDQKDEFYGDSDAFEGGVYNTNPLSQENYAFVLTVEF